MAVKPLNPKYIPKPYEQMDYPGQRILIDVKFVPFACLKTRKSSAKNSFSTLLLTSIPAGASWRPLRSTVLTCSSNIWLKRFSRIKCVQTDNGSEFTNRFTTYRDKPTLFQKHLEAHGITHKLIRPYTPRHNGKVERSHRKDNERFYATHSFYSFEGFARQLKVYNRRDYNNFPTRPLNWKTPSQVLRDYLQSV